MSIASIPYDVNTLGHIPAVEWIDFGWHIIPVSKNKIPLVKGWTERQPDISEFPAGCRFSQVCGQQPDGTFIIGPEFDHNPAEGIDATANYEAFKNKISPSLFQKLYVTRSTGGLGYHMRASIPRPIGGSIIRDDTGKKIGDLRSSGGHLIMQQPEKWLHGAPWTMEVLTEAEQDELLAALNWREPVQATPTSIDWTAASTLDIDSLLTNGLPSRFRPTCQGAHYLKNQIPAHRSSEIRYALIEELVRCDYTDTEIAALARHFDLGAIERKGLSWVESDIERIIGKVRANGPRSRRKVSQTAIETDDTGQPRYKHEAPYLFWLSQHEDSGKVMMSRPERAKSYGVSIRTLDRIESALIARGKIRRGLSSNRLISWVELAPEGTAISCDTHIDPDPTAVFGVGGVGEGGNVASPILAHVVEDAVETLGDSRIRKHRDAVILGIVRATLPDADPELVSWLAKHATAWRRQRRADDAMREKLRAMTLRQLKQKHRGLSGKAADLHKAGKPRQAWVYSRLAWFVQREMDTPERKAEATKGTRAKAIQQVLGGIQ